MSLPAAVDVAIVGGGLTGLVAGLRLAKNGAKVVVLEAGESLGQGAVGRGSGQAHWGLSEHPIQLASAIGDMDAKELMEFSQLSLRDLQSFTGHSLDGGVWAASMDREDLGVQRSTHWLLGQGLVCSAVEADELKGLLGEQVPHSFALGRFHPQEGALDPVALLDSIADMALQEGLWLMLGHRVSAVDTGSEGLIVRGVGFELQAELALFAAGSAVQAIEPWFTQKIFPVRAQHLWSSSLDVFGATGRSQHGYVQWGPARKGGVVSGCRWASAHLEVGEARLGLNEAVSGRLFEFAGKLGLSEEATKMEWSSVMGFSCDGLPIVGPLPGQPRKIACGGYNGQDLGLAVACATRVADAILEKAHPPIPQRMRSGRFL